MSHFVLDSCMICAPELHGGAQNGTSSSLKSYARVPYIIYKEADSGMTAVYRAVCHMRGKTGAFVIYGGGEAYIRYNIWERTGSVLACLIRPVFPKNPLLSPPSLLVFFDLCQTSGKFCIYIENSVEKFWW